MNQTIQTMLSRKSIRKYTTKEPTDEVIETVVSAGQQAPFASQLGSILLSRSRKDHPFNAPLLFTICVDAYKLELIMDRREWKMFADDLMLLIMGMQDAALMAENMVIAAESVSMGSCFLGAAPFRARKIIEQYKLPSRVFPMVQLVMGYPAEDPPPRPRYPMDFVLFEDSYPVFGENEVQEAMDQMDKGYLEQDYYHNLDAMIKLTDERHETYSYNDYSWSEHICRKWGQQYFPNTLLQQLEVCGFKISQNKET
jgi:nitroreductase